ncbi:MAG: flagellar assembly protein FliX [Methyloligellaceae bacterium]
MRVNSSKNVGSNAGAKKTKKNASGSKFSPIENEEASSATSVNKTAPLSDLDAILALQSVEAVDQKEQRKKAVFHADQMLSELEKLKIAILSGQHTRAHLLKLKNLIDHRPEYAEDSGLIDLLDQINLRVEVELAKFNAKR